MLDFIFGAFTALLISMVLSSFATALLVMNSDLLAQTGMHLFLGLWSVTTPLVGFIVYKMGEC